MKHANKLLSLLLAVVLLVALAVPALAAPESDVVVLYTNDVHCAVEENIGYPGLAAYKAEMQKTFGQGNVLLVDAGDAVQGKAIGTLSNGEYIVEMMNQLGYDVAVPGNHEFDYGMDQMKKLMSGHKAAVLSCNFIDLGTNKPVFEGYKLLTAGGAKIAFVGVCTPESFTKSTPAYFQDANGKYIYGFCEDSSGAKLYEAVQSSIDAAKAAGADYVIGVGHLGIEETSEPWRSTDVIAHTAGFNAFIDGHSHSTIAGEQVKDQKGNNVLLTSTGTQLEAIGKLTIAKDGSLKSELVTEYTAKDAATEQALAKIKANYEEILKKVVAKTDVALTTLDPATGERRVRSGETNLGDLCADAYRSVLGADIGLVNGGGVRADIPAGDVTFEQIIAVHPFGNAATLVEATGQQILDALEMGSRNAPGENGGFLQVSGLRYTVDTAVPSSVVVDDKNNFIKVDGAYRVKDVKVGNAALDLAKTYKVASHNYMLKSGGDGMTMFNGAKVLRDEVMLDNEVLITYITDTLKGVVGAQYAKPTGEGRIQIVGTPAPTQEAVKPETLTQPNTGAAV